MCGVAALWDPRGWSRSHGQTLIRMRDALAHRGPDGSGEWIDESSGLGLAHRRLSIIDLSASGGQPMHSSDGRWSITYNGEIYNYRSLRAELERSGVRFRGTSDTEVLVESIARLGFEATLARCAGMFAMVLWDRRDHVLHLARDRFGEKPLYYAVVDGRVLVGSELKAITAAGMIDSGDLDRTAIEQVLRYNCVRAPRTIYRQVRKLPAGSRATVSSTGDVCVRRYWDLSAVIVEAKRSAASLPVPTFNESVDAVESRLMQVVDEQMISDVPLGALLSGGIDSSLVVALMARGGSRAVRTFSIGFREAGYNEANHAKAVAAHLGTEHTEVYVTPEEARAVIPCLAGVYDEPFADASQIPTILVSRLARTAVTVALTGDGGDEFFGGYDRYFDAKRLMKLPHALRATASGLIRSMSPDRWDALLSIVPTLRGRLERTGRAGDRLHKLAHVLRAESRVDLYDRFVAHWKVEGAPAAAHAEDPRPVIAVPAGLDSVEEMMLVDALTYLTDEVLVKVDRAAMSTSLETRAPLLDHRIAELAWGLPLDHRVEARSGKRVLKALLHRYVPPVIVDRPKMGFGVPMGDWLRGPLREWAESLLSEERMRTDGWLAPGPIRGVWQSHLDGRSNAQYALWNVLMFQAWLHR
jgi:asparagine synthase (glutamine-hydrolysing)